MPINQRLKSFGYHRNNSYWSIITYIMQRARCIFNNSVITLPLNYVAQYQIQTCYILNNSFKAIELQDRHIINESQPKTTYTATQHKNCFLSHLFGKLSLQFVYNYQIFKWQFLTAALLVKLSTKLPLKAATNELN